MTDNPTTEGVSKALGVSAEAASTLLGMVEYCLNQRVCMGMDEGIKCFDSEEEHDFVKELRALLAAPIVPRPILTVWEGPMPESNGKSNFTAILMRKGGGTLLRELSDALTIARSEYPDRVRYEADRVRWLIGELAEKPDILAYDANKHSGYVAPPPATSTLTTKIDKYKSREQP